MEGKVGEFVGEVEQHKRRQRSWIVGTVVGPHQQKGQWLVRFGDMEKVMKSGQLRLCKGLAGMDPLQATGLPTSPTSSTGG